MFVISKYTYITRGVCLGVLLLAPVFSGCGTGTSETAAQNAPIVTYPMGQSVQVGPLTYNVLETIWKSQLGGGPGAKIPKNRYLIVKVTVTNGASQNWPIPEMTLLNASGQTFPEMSEGVDDVPKWLGVLRSLTAVETQEGSVVFDVPIGAYKLQVHDGGEIGSEKKALIELPLQLE